MNHPRRAFTLIELLVVVAIIVALLAILLPSLNRAVLASYQVVCLSNQHQLHAASLAYAANHFGHLPYRDANHPSDPSVWYHTVGASDHRGVWLDYIGDYTLADGSDVFFCPFVTNSGLGVLSGTDAVGTKTNQGWPVNWYGAAKHYVTSYTYFANYNNPSYIKLDPVDFRRVTAPSGLAMFSDTIRRDGWNQLTGNHTKNGMAIPHASWPTAPSGANAARLDGSASWVEFTGYDDPSASAPIVKYIQGSASMGFWWPRHN